jgi:hypothetical protein
VVWSRAWSPSPSAVGSLLALDGVARGNDTDELAASDEDDEEQPTPSSGADDSRALLAGHLVSIADDTAWIEQRVFGFLGLDAVPREVVDVGLVPVKQR